jgi:acyl carrier protein
MIENKIKNVMAAIFNVSVEQINEETSSDTIDSWDSLNLINLVTSLEEEFDIHFDDEEITEMLNFKLIKQIIYAKIK